MSLLATKINLLTTAVLGLGVTASSTDASLQSTGLQLDDPKLNLVQFLRTTDAKRGPAFRSEGAIGHARYVKPYDAGGASETPIPAATKLQAVTHCEAS